MCDYDKSEYYQAEDLPAYLASYVHKDESNPVLSDFFNLAYSDAKDEFDKIYLTNLLESTNGDVTQAAAKSGIARQNLYEKFKKYFIEPDKYRK